MRSALLVERSIWRLLENKGLEDLAEKVDDAITSLAVGRHNTAGGDYDAMEAYRTLLQYAPDRFLKDGIDAITKYIFRECAERPPAVVGKEALRLALTLASIFKELPEYCWHVAWECVKETSFEKEYGWGVADAGQWAVVGEDFANISIAKAARFVDACVLLSRWFKYTPLVERIMRTRVIMRGARTRTLDPLGIAKTMVAGKMKGALKEAGLENMVEETRHFDYHYHA